MTQKRINVKHTNFKDQFGLKEDYRATVGALKEALNHFDDDMPIGILYDSGFAYCDIHEIIIKNGLVKIVGD